MSPQSETLIVKAGLPILAAVFFGGLLGTTTHKVAEIADRQRHRSPWIPIALSAVAVVSLLAVLSIVVSLYNLLEKEQPAGVAGKTAKRDQDAEGDLRKRDEDVQTNPALTGREKFEEEEQLNAEADAVGPRVRRNHSWKSEALHSKIAGPSGDTVRSPPAQQQQQRESERQRQRERGTSNNRGQQQTTGQRPSPGLSDVTPRNASQESLADYADEVPFDQYRP